MSWLLYCNERNPGTHWIGHCMGLRFSLDVVANKKVPASTGKGNPSSST